MKLHERHDQVTRARIDISTAIAQAVEKHGLTFAELTNILGSEITQWSKWQVRDERTPDEPRSVEPNFSV